MLETGGELEDKFGANGRDGRSGLKGFCEVTRQYFVSVRSLKPPAIGKSHNITFWHSVIRVGLAAFKVQTVAQFAGKCNCSVS